MQSSSQQIENSSGSSGETTGADGGETEPKAGNIFIETLDQVIDTVGALVNRFDTSGSVFKIEDARGARAEVSLSIPADGVGEVTMVLGKMRKSYPARAIRPEQEFKRGTAVRIADVGVSTMFVDSL
jgi:hypothetical protein